MSQQDKKLDQNVGSFWLFYVHLGFNIPQFGVLYVPKSNNLHL